MTTAIKTATKPHPVDPESEEFWKLAEHSPVAIPKCLWLGATRGNGLQAAIGFSASNNNVWIYLALCEHSVAGFRALRDLIAIFDLTFAEANISFAVDLTNASVEAMMKRLLPKAIVTAQTYTRLGRRAAAPGARV